MKSGARTKRRGTPNPRLLIAGLVAAGVVVVLVAAAIANQPAVSAPVAWARLGTEDAHSLAFVGGDANHLVFGHHGGVLETVDGGRTWTPLDVREDAMSISAATDASLVIAGHEVFMASRDEGRTWAPMETDLPDLDIHGFTRDPFDPGRMWAYLASGGLWASSDYGSHWTQVRDDTVAFPIAVRDGSATSLLGIDTGGFVVSRDGGRSWTTGGTPPTYPMTALAATQDGFVIYAGSPDGLFRTTDGGGTWVPTTYTGSVFAVATTSIGDVVAVVNQDADFFRSADNGGTWPTS